MNTRSQSFSYVLATILLVLVVGWVGRHTWQELRRLNRSFASMQSDDFYYSEHIKASVRELNGMTLRISLLHNPVDEAAFQQASQHLQQWIQAHQDTLPNRPRHELMKRIGTGFELCLAQNSRLMNAQPQSGTDTSPLPLLEQVQSNAAPVLDLCNQLADFERAERTQFMKRSHEALAWIQRLLAVMLMLLVILAGTIVVAVYRGVVGPLRIKLTESRVLAARNEKLASLGTLAAGVAHEIRNPLTAINVRLHSLKKNLVANSSEQEDALVIGHEIQRLERIVQEFLQFARPADPKLHIISADSLIAKVRALFTPQLQRTSIQLNVESVPDIWVAADPHQMEQVLINLIQNAAESMEHTGTITLRSRTDTARLSGRLQPVVLLEVKDTGKGIPPDVQKRMFDPFFTTKEEGTGLGLAIAARIVEKHGGALECRSEMGRGTTFTILLPRPNPETNNETST